MKLTAFALFLSLLAAPLAALDLLPPVDTCSVIRRLGEDLERLSDYTAPQTCFEISFNLPAQQGRSMYQAGAFHPETGQIALARDIDLTSVFGRSVLLHEMVHAAQYQQDDIPECVGRLESEAYFVQGLYLSDAGEARDAMLVHLMSGLMGTCPGDEY